MPLAGVRVVSLAINLPGPLAVARLCALGAQVIKVEPPTGDPLASAAPRWYADLVSGQTVVRWDLKVPDQRALFDRELAQSDLLVTAMRPSATKRLGLHDIGRRFPELSIVEIVGHDGELAEAPGHDLTYQAAHGTLTPPTMPTVPVADLLGAERAIAAALLSLMNRQRTGRGESRRIVLEDAAADAGAAVRHRLMGHDAPLGGADPAYGIYSTADGHVAVAAIEPHFRARLTAAVGATTREELEQVFRARPTAHWVSLATRKDIPINEIRRTHAGVAG
nr:MULTISPECIES: CoA transferase [Nocardia]